MPNGQSLRSKIHFNTSRGHVCLPNLEINTFHPLPKCCKRPANYPSIHQDRVLLRRPNLDLTCLWIDSLGMLSMDFIGIKELVFIFHWSR